jgi:hypothetical protein
VSSRLPRSDTCPSLGRTRRSLHGRAAAKRAEADASADAEAAAEQAAHLREANAERLATMVYLSCSQLLIRDQVAAMTNAVCVDSFLQNGLR